MRKVPDPEQRPCLVIWLLSWLPATTHQVVSACVCGCFLVLLLLSACVSVVQSFRQCTRRKTDSWWHAAIFWQSGIRAGLNHVIIPELGIITNPIIIFLGHNLMSIYSSSILRNPWGWLRSLVFLIRASTPMLGWWCYTDYGSEVRIKVLLVHTAPHCPPLCSGLLPPSFLDSCLL